MTQWSAKTTYQGYKINQGTNQILKALNKMVRTKAFGGESENVTMMQGSYNAGGVKASAGTHDGGGAFDLTPYNWKNRVKALRLLGCASYHRPFLKGYWGEHVHTIVCGDGTASSGALAQVQEYYRGRNALANNAKDTDWRPAALPILFHLDGDLSPRYAKNDGATVREQPYSSTATKATLKAGDALEPVAVVKNKYGHYWFITADGWCGYEGSFTTTLPAVETEPEKPADPPAVEPDPAPAPSDDTPQVSASWLVRFIAAIVGVILKFFGRETSTAGGDTAPEAGDKDDDPEPVDDGPTPKPITDPAPATTSFWVGYGNVYGSYKLDNDRDWLDRAPKIAQLIHDMGVSMFIALELHGDTTAAGGDGKAELVNGVPQYEPLLDALVKLDPQWAIAEGEGGNQCLYKSGDLPAPVTTRDLLMPGDRWTTGWKFNTGATAFWVQAAHTTAGSTKARVADREAQGRFLATHIDTSNPVILGIDRNNATDYPGSPLAVLTKAGMVDARAKCATDVVNLHLPSHHGGAPGQWIDGIHTSPSVVVNKCALVSTGDLSDHNFIKALVTIGASA